MAFEAAVASLDDSIRLCDVALTESRELAWKLGGLRLTTEYDLLQQQLAQLEQRPEDMLLALRYHKLRSAYTEGLTRFEKLEAIMEAQRLNEDEDFLHAGAVGSAASSALAAEPPSLAGCLFSSSAEGPLSPAEGRRRRAEGSQDPPAVGQLPESLSSPAAGSRPLAGDIRSPAAAAPPCKEGEQRRRRPAPFVVHQAPAGAASVPRTRVARSAAGLAARHRATRVEAAHASARPKASEGTMASSVSDLVGDAQDTRVPAEPPTASELAALQRLLDTPDELQVVSDDNFLSVACGRDAIDLEGLLALLSSVAQQGGIQEKPLLENLREEYVCYDFDGDGQLQMHECHKLLRQLLRERRRSLGFVRQDVDVPHTTIETEGYRLERAVVQGSQGEAKIASHCTGGQACVKIVAMSKWAKQAVDDLRVDIEILHMPGNRHVAKIFDVFQDDVNFYLICEPCEGGDLARLRWNARRLGMELSAAWWWELFCQCLEGLAFLHSMAVMHCDLRESNVVLRTQEFEPLNVALVDFGLTPALSHKGRRILGTPGYIPPETWATSRWVPKGDAFSLGVCLLQVVSGRSGAFTEGARPGPSANEDVAEITLQRPAPLQILSSRMPQLAELLGLLLEKEVASRFHVFQALSIARLDHTTLSSGTAVELPAASGLAVSTI